jgi:pyrroline-5-carboxylate reductase
MIEQCQIASVGAGNMGAALLRGIVSHERLPAKNITVCDIDETALAPLAELGMETTSDPEAAIADKHIILLAVKPQIAPGLIDRLSPSITPAQLLISIMAGVTTAAIEARLEGNVAVVRSMPQLLAFAGVAATAICPGAHAGTGQLLLAKELFDQVGTTVVVEEHQMDAVTGLSGSGPAYVYSIIEALVEGGVSVGLPGDVATTLAAQTVLGAAHTVLETGEKPADLRARVTSPNGTTVAGLQALRDKGLADALVSAVQAATARSRELGR